MQEPAQRYRKVIRGRGISMEMELCHISENRYRAVFDALKSIISREQDFVIDLTDCDQVFALAVGTMMAEVKNGQRISVQRYDRRTGADIDCDGDGHVVQSKNAWLTVPELIALHGGTIHPDTRQLTENSTDDLQTLWDIVTQNPKEWNQRISILRKYESRSFSDQKIVLPLRQLENSMSEFDTEVPQLLEILEQFWRNGIISNFGSRDFLNYTYSSNLFRYCTEKAGNVLEVKTLLEALSLKDGAEPFFRDGMMSVNIDWDGVVHDPQERFPETRNEVDVVLMHGMTPLFISCKNGNIGDEELYKLHTVATRFGGPDAKKMLIATNLDRKSGAANRSFAQRAWDMDIYLVKDAAELDKNEWEEAFRTAMQ